MSRFELAGRVALVTGGGSGIGRAIARELSQRGASVLVTDVNEVSAEAVASGLRDGGRTAWSMPLDVTDQSAWEALADQLRGTERWPTILVNNAGIAAWGQALDVPVATWRQVFDVCFWGVLHGCHTFGRRWVEASERALVINISSASGFLGLPHANAYAPAKAGVLALNHALSCEIDPSLVQFTAVCPGGVRTGIADGCAERGTIQPTTERKLRDMLEPEGRVPETVAKAAVRGALRGRPMVRVYSESWGVDLLRRLLPTRLSIAVGRRVARWLNR